MLEEGLLGLPSFISCRLKEHTLITFLGQNSDTACSSNTKKHQTNQPQKTTTTKPKQNPKTNKNKTKPPTTKIILWGFL